MWRDGKPEKTGLFLIEWMNGDPWPMVYLVIKCKDNNLYLYGDKSVKPYPLSESAIQRHMEIPQPEYDGMNDELHTTAFNPETCCWHNDETCRPLWYDPDFKNPDINFENILKYFRVSDNDLNCLLKNEN